MGKMNKAIAHDIKATAHLWPVEFNTTLPPLASQRFPRAYSP
jgi:hypothetical protein